MYEILMRSRWLIIGFMALTIGSIVAYVSDGTVSEEVRVARAGTETVEVAGEYRQADDEQSGAGAAIKPNASPDDRLIDRTIGEDVRPEEEKQAEADALAAAAAATAARQAALEQQASEE
jgi:hypothetical protein